MNRRSLFGLSAVKIGKMIKDREVSPVEVVNTFLERIYSYDNKINSFIRVMEGSALYEAKKLEDEIINGHWRSPLHGVPFAAKDIIDTKGVPTTAGSKILNDYIPTEDAYIIKKLKDAGAILVGKLNLHEFAFGITSRNPHYGSTLNPWDLTKMCGGSSSGSAAALSSGFVPLTLGTDTGGSIRIPSALCGTIGLKPTYGLVSLKGILPLAWSLDHVGPMSMHVEDILISLNIITDRDSNAITDLKKELSDYRLHQEDDLKGIVVGIPNTFFYENLRKDIEEVILKGIKNFETLGASVREVEIPGIIEADRAAHTVLFSESAASLEIHVRNRPQDMGEEVMANVRLGMTIPATRYIQAQRIRTKLVTELAKVFSQVDLLVVPGTTVDAPSIESQEVSINSEKILDVRSALTRFTRYFNIAGNPVLSIPVGFSSQHLPVGMQVIGRPFNEDTLLRAGYLYQKAFPLTPFMPSID